MADFVRVQIVLFTLCAMNELFFVALYLLAFDDPLDLSFTEFFQARPKPNSNTLPRSAVGNDQWPACAMEAARYVFKVPFVFQSIYLLYASPFGANKLASRYPKILAAVCFLPVLLKEVINVVQLVNASRWLAEGDVAERRRKAK